jgi:hypothetical protein
LMKEASYRPLVRDEQLSLDIVAVTTWFIKSGRWDSPVRMVDRSHFFGKIFNESLGIQLGLLLLFEASTADAKRSRLLKFLS